MKDKQLRTLSIIFLTFIALMVVVSSAAATDGALPVQTTWDGNYCLAHGGVGLEDGGPQSFQVNVQGQPVAAYLYWSGRYIGSASGDSQITAKFNAGGTSTYNAAASDSAFAEYDNRYYYTYRSGNIASDVPGPGMVTVTVNGLNTPEGHGAGLVVISQGINCLEGHVQLNFGLDGFYWEFPPAAGPDTQVTCVTFGSENRARTMDMQMFVGGILGVAPRSNRIWYAVGSGSPPTDIIGGGNSANILSGPLPPSAAPPYPLNGEAGQWDDFATTINIPAGATHACFQIESIDGRDPYNGASGVWIELMTRLPVRPTAVSLANIGAHATSGLPFFLSAALLGVVSLEVLRRKKK